MSTQAIVAALWLLVSALCFLAVYVSRRGGETTYILLAALVTTAMAVYLA